MTQGYQLDQFKEKRSEFLRYYQLMTIGQYSFHSLVDGSRPCPCSQHYQSRGLDMGHGLELGHALCSKKNVCAVAGFL